MKFNEDKVDEMALALLFLTATEEQFAKNHTITRAWKGLDWDVLDRMHQKDWIHDPKGKAKSVTFTEQGERLMKELFITHFGLDGEGD